VITAGALVGNVKLVYPKTYIYPYDGQDAFIIIVSLVRSSSVGEVKLQGQNPILPPLIDPRYFDDPQDLEDFTEGIKTK